VTPRDAEAAKGLENWSQIEAPAPNFREQVFFHELRDAAAGRASIWNAGRKIGVEMGFSRAQLPFFTQWKMLGAGAYVLGLEPSNAPLANRKEMLDSGKMPVLEAGESREFGLNFEFWSEKTHLSGK
jgi:galactose mutarotase-like enzyme